MAVKLIYVDPAADSLGADGSKDHPYNTTDAGVTACNTAENVLNLRRGRVYAPPSGIAGGLWFANHAPAGFTLVKSYGDEEMPPTFYGGMRMLPGDAGWSYVGDGLWKKAITSNSNYADPEQMRLYVGSQITGTAANNSLGTGYGFGKAVARYPNGKSDTEAQILAFVGSDGSTAKRLWMYTRDSGGYLYVYTGTDKQDPPTYYGGITLVGSNNKTDATGMGRAYGVAIYSNSTGKNVRVTEVDSIYAASSSFRVFATGGTANQDNGFEHCRGYAFARNGLMTVGVPSVYIARAYARDMTIDAVATLDEDWNYPTKIAGITWLPDSQDATQLGSCTTDNVFERVRTFDGYHINTLIGSMSSTDRGTVNGRLIDCEGSNPNRLYGSALSPSLLGAGNVARIDRFKGHDAVRFVASTGDGTAIISDSVFENGKKPFLNYTAAQGQTPPLSTISGINIASGTGFGTQEIGALTFNRCTILNPYGFMLEASDSGTGSLVAQSIIFNDSLLVDLTYLDDAQARSFSYTYYPKPGLSIKLNNNSLPAGLIEFNNTRYWTGAAGQVRVGRWDAVSPNTTSATMADSPEITGTFSEADPMVDARGYLLEGSPLKYAAPLTDLAYDVDGRARSNPTSIGAYEYVEPRASRL